MPNARAVSVGGQEYTIAPFRGFKGELAMSLVSRVTAEAREVLDTVQTHSREWRAANPLTVTREVCLDRIQTFEQLAKSARDLMSAAPEEEPEADADGNRQKTKGDLEAEASHYDSRVAIWRDQLEQLGDRPSLELPNPADPPLGETVLEVFPKAMDVAPETVKRLLALVVIPNEDLRKADEEDRAEEALDELGKELFYEGLIEELLELTVEATEVIAQAVERYKGPFGKLQALKDRWFDRATAPKEDKEESTQPAASTSGSPTESTSSPAATDGPAERSSSESDGESSLASASA